MLKIAVDFGGVLSIHDKGNLDGRAHKSVSINIPDALDSLKFLKSQGHKLYINSFCGKGRAALTRQALIDNASGVFDDVYFVRDKKFKGLVTKYLGCDVMIDDTLEILTRIRDDKTCPEVIWFAGDPTFSDPRHTLPKFKSWPQIVEYIGTIKPSAIADDSVDLKNKLY
jgi:hypothetical protein